MFVWREGVSDGDVRSVNGSGVCKFRNPPHHYFFVLFDGTCAVEERLISPKRTAGS